MSILRIDFETRSLADLADCGVHVYAASPSTDILCMAYAFDDEEPELWLPGDPVPFDIVNHISDDGEIHAWNAQFERTIWRNILTPRYKFPQPSDAQFHCSMAFAAAYGLPQSLDWAADVLGVQEQKDREGKRVMQQLCRPRSRSADGTPVWWDDPGKLSTLYEYCKQDVRSERAVAACVKPLPPSERAVYLLDQKINDRGVQLDVPLAHAAMVCAAVATEQANAELAEITEGEVQAVTEVIGITHWVQQQGIECNSIAKDAVAEIMSRKDVPEKVRQVLQLRTDAGKSSVAKVQKMLEYAATDGRMRGMLAYHGAGTGRWAGRGPQPQNYPRGTVSEVEDLIPLVLEKNVAGLALFAPPLEVMSSSLRSLMCAKPEHRIMAADFAAIEARVLAWLAGQEDLLQMFRDGVDVYKALASRIYQVPTDKVTKTQRFVGKTATLGLGYAMGAKKFVDACLKMAGISITEAFSQEVVTTYRAANDRIKAFWYALEEHALAAVRFEARPHTPCPITYTREGEWLFCTLPSGRTLKYCRPKIVPKEMPWVDKFTGQPAVKDCIQVMGFNGMTNKWERQYLYGGLLAENVTQAVARDLMAEAMIRVENAGYEVILTVHDEVVAEVPDKMGTVQEFERLMCELPAWAAGCPVAAEAWEGPRYRK